MIEKWTLRGFRQKRARKRQENILTAIAALNERILRSGSDSAKRGIALSWLFHLIGDIHPPVHAVTLFSREYPKGDQGGTETCVRVAQGRAALSLHQLWDELLTSSKNSRTLSKLAIDLRNRFPRADLTELATSDPELWATESYEIATKIAYQNGAFRGTPKAKRRDCREVTNAMVLPNGYAAIARKIADRRIMLAGYRLADVLQRISAESVP